MPGALTGEPSGRFFNPAPDRFIPSPRAALQRKVDDHRGKQAAQAAELEGYRPQDTLPEGWRVTIHGRKPVPAGYTSPSPQHQIELVSVSFSYCGGQTVLLEDMPFEAGLTETKLIAWLRDEATADLIVPPPATGRPPGIVGGPKLFIAEEVEGLREAWKRVHTEIVWDRDAEGNILNEGRLSKLPGSPTFEEVMADLRHASGGMATIMDLPMLEAAKLNHWQNKYQPESQVYQLGKHCFVQRYEELLTVHGALDIQDCLHDLYLDGNTDEPFERTLEAFGVGLRAVERGMPGDPRQLFTPADLARLRNEWQRDPAELEDRLRDLTEQAPFGGEVEMGRETLEMMCSAWWMSDHAGDNRRIFQLGERAFVVEDGPDCSVHEAPGIATLLTRLDDLAAGPGVAQNRSVETLKSFGVPVTALVTEDDLEPDPLGQDGSVDPEDEAVSASM